MVLDLEVAFSNRRWPAVRCWSRRLLTRAPCTGLRWSTSTIRAADRSSSRRYTAAVRPAWQPAPRSEWVEMYRRGIPAARIAQVVESPSRRARDHKGASVVTSDTAWAPTAYSPPNRCLWPGSFCRGLGRVRQHDRRPPLTTNLHARILEAIARAHEWRCQNG